MGRVASGHPSDPVDTVFYRAVELATSRRLVPNRANRAHVYAFAEAFVVAWLRERGRGPEAVARRRLIRGARDFVRLRHPDSTRRNQMLVTCVELPYVDVDATELPTRENA
jgi:hypothetical protein